MEASAPRRRRFRGTLFDALAHTILFAILACSGSEASPDRLCIFDFDETLWIRATNSVAEEARRVVRACVRSGYEIAIATVNPFPLHVRRVLQEEISEALFPTELLLSPAFQFGRRNKTVAMNLILRYYGMQDAPECAVLFDDNELANKPHADATGVHWILVDETIGITMDDFDRAEQKLDRFCP